MFTKSKRTRRMASTLGAASVALLLAAVPAAAGDYGRHHHGSPELGFIIGGAIASLFLHHYDHRPVVRRHVRPRHHYHGPRYGHFGKHRHFQHRGHVRHHHHHSPRYRGHHQGQPKQRFVYRHRSQDHGHNHDRPRQQRHAGRQFSYR